MKHVINIAGLIIIMALMEFGLNQFVEVEALRPVIGGLAGDLTVDEWLRQFFQWASISVGAGGFTFLLWYFYGQFSSPNWLGTGSKRPWWLFLTFIPCLAAVAGIILLPTAQTGTMMANAFLVFNGIFMYWLPSALFSPTMVKTHVPGSSWFRGVRDALPR